MHTDHDVFIRGLEQERKLKVTYFSDEHRENLARLCGPLYCGTGKAEADGPECYYLWDFEADQGYNFLALPPEQIVSMELTENAYSIEEVSNLSEEPGK